MTDLKKHKDNPMRSRHTPALISLLAVVLFGGLIAWTTQPEQNPPADTRVVFLVRHADIAPNSGKDPDLTALGHAHAAGLTRMLSAEPLAAVFVTATERSRQTAFGIKVKKTEYAAMDADALMVKLQKLPMNSSALVVAHSNTVPLILAALGGPTIENLTKNEFNRMYAVVIQDGEFVRAVELRY